MSTVNVQEEMIDRMAREIAAEIDFEVMTSLMMQSGWHKVKLERFKNNNHAIDIALWVEEHAVGGHIKHGSTFVFEEKGDAVNFALKWA